LLKISGLNRPIGEQKLKFKSSNLNGAAVAFDPPSETVTLAFSSNQIPFANVSILAGDPDWSTSSSSRRYRWRARLAPHPDGLRAMSIETAGGPFAVKATAREIDAAGAAGGSDTTVEVSMSIGDDDWFGSTPNCKLSSNGARLKCR
jgi:hypothetical protein